MTKEIYLLKGRPEEDYSSFKTRLLSLSNKVAAEINPSTFKLCITVQKPPAISIIPFQSARISAISITHKTGKKIDALINAPGFTGGYTVEEALPVSYHKTWQDGSPTPGVCLLTLFHKRPDLERNIFLKRCYEGHTPLSLELHPLWNYNRNVVNNVLTEDSCWYDGIVEEQFRKASDLLNPFKFFGPPLKTPLHMYKVFKDTKSFIDMKRIETYLAEEYHLRSL